MSQNTRMPTTSGKEQHTNIIDFPSSRHRDDLQIGVTPNRDFKRLQSSTQTLLDLQSSLIALEENLEALQVPMDLQSSLIALKENLGALQKVLAGTSGEHPGLAEAIRKYLGMLDSPNV